VAWVTARRVCREQEWEWGAVTPMGLNGRLNKIMEPVACNYGLSAKKFDVAEEAGRKQEGRPGKAVRLHEPRLIVRHSNRTPTTERECDMKVEIGPE